MNKPLIALAAIGTMFTAAPAVAGGIAVEYSDLNLNSAKGQSALERRIDKAAKAACGYDTARTGSRMTNPKVQKCYRAAKAQATQQMAVIVDSERLGG